MDDMKNVKERFLDTVQNSWTWARLTYEEGITFVCKLSTAELKGRKRQKYDRLRKLYAEFLDNLGYSWEKWREPLREEGCVKMLTADMEVSLPMWVGESRADTENRLRSLLAEAGLSCKIQYVKQI